MKKDVQTERNEANENLPILSAGSLKLALWQTLNLVKNDSIQAGQADAVASQAREILRTLNVQLRVSQQARRPVPSDVIKFSENIDD